MWKHLFVDNLIYLSKLEQLIRVRADAGRSRARVRQAARGVSRRPRRFWFVHVRRSRIGRLRNCPRPER